MKDGSAAPWIHPTAIVDEGAELGRDTRIWHFAHVMSGAKIGRGCVISQGCFVGGTVRIGDGCRIQNHVSLYDGVSLEDDVFVGPSAVFTNVARPRAAFPRKPSWLPTLVQRGASIGANATIVAGIVIGERAFVAAGAVVTKDVPPHALVEGTPARVVGFVCACGDTLVRETSRPTSLVCARCGIGPARDAWPPA